MRASGTVTAFAPGVLGFFLAGGDALEVRILIEFRPDVGVTSFAGVPPNEAVRSLFLQAVFLSERQRR